MLTRQRRLGANSHARMSDVALQSARQLLVCCESLNPGWISGKSQVVTATLACICCLRTVVQPCTPHDHPVRPGQCMVARHTWLGGCVWRHSGGITRALCRWHGLSSRRPCRPVSGLGGGFWCGRDHRRRRRRGSLPRGDQLQQGPVDTGQVDQRGAAGVDAPKGGRQVRRHDLRRSTKLALYLRRSPSGCGAIAVSPQEVVQFAAEHVQKVSQQVK